MDSRHNLVKKIYRESTITRVSNKIKLLGVNCKYDAINILNMRLFLTIIVFTVLIITSSFGYYLAPIFAFLTWILYEYVYLDLKIRRRISLLDYEALFFFEVMALSIESGKDIKGALDVTVKNVSGELSDEFAKTLEEVRLGKSLQEALKGMKTRIPSDAINNVILNITQSSIFGSDIVDSLYSQLDYLREKRLQEVKANINRLPIKLSIVSVLFFIPILLLIILSPVVINMISK